MLRTNFRATSVAMALLALVVVVFFPTGIPSAEAKPEPRQQIEALKVHIISTMLATRGLGEWGFSALVEANGHWILIDTGHDPDIVLGNAQQMGVDLSQVTDVVLSHFHPDHTGGLMKLRQELLKTNPEALARIHVGKGFFSSRRAPGGAEEVNLMIAKKSALESTGARFFVHDKPTELFPGVWVTGPVPRERPERNWSGSLEVKTGDHWVEDTVPDSQSLVLDTEKGLVVLSGCGHAGIVNTLEYARTAIRSAPIHAAIGGFHLLNADDKQLTWTSTQLRAMGLEHFLGAHCTGIEAVFRIREEAGLSRQTCVVGAVGATFSLEDGLDPRQLAR